MSQIALSAGTSCAVLNLAASTPTGLFQRVTSAAERACRTSSRLSTLIFLGYSVFQPRLEASLSRYDLDHRANRQALAVLYINVPAVSEIPVECFYRLRYRVVFPCE